MQRLRAGVSAVQGPLRGDWGDPSPPRAQTLSLHPLWLAGASGRRGGHFRKVCDCPRRPLHGQSCCRPPAALQVLSPGGRSQLASCVQRPRDLFPEAEQGLRTRPLSSGRCCGAGPAGGRHRLPCLSSTPLLIEGRACAWCLRMERRWGPGFPHLGWWGPPGLSAWRCCGQDAGLSSGLMWVLLTRED